MRNKIFNSLLITGITTAIIVFIVLGVFYYQGMQERRTEELINLNKVVSSVITTEDESNSKKYLEEFSKAGHEKIHIAWFDQKGTIYYDNEDNGDADRYLESLEVNEAIKTGSGYNVHKDKNDMPKIYIAQKIEDGTILRFSLERNLPINIFSNFSPEIFIFIIVFLFASVMLAKYRTDRILSPLQSLGDMVQRIMSGENIKELPVNYSELQPLYKKVAEQRNQIEKYLEDMEEDRNNIRIVMNTIYDGIILLNDKKEIIDYNRRAEKIFNPSEDKRFRKISSMYCDHDWLRAVDRAYRDENRQKYTMTIADKPFKVIMTRTILPEEQHGVLIVLRDMTAEHIAEKMRREFSANVSHELKTPLTTISGFAEMIAKGMCKDTEDIKNFSNKIHQESRRMLSLIDTIMHLSKIEEKETTISWKLVSVDSVLKYVADLITSQATKKDLKINLDIEPVYMYGNAALLSELFMNLLDNAVKYNVEGGNITVHIKRVKEKLMKITISDTGVGIPEEKQNRVFERFFRAEESRNKATGGSGLGLSICKHIIERHNGKIEISSIEGKGTTVIVELPCLSDEEILRENATEITAQQEVEEVESGELAAMEAAEDKEIEKEIKENKEVLQVRRKHKKDEKAQMRKEKRKKERKKKKNKGKE